MPQIHPSSPHRPHLHPFVPRDLVARSQPYVKIAIDVLVGPEKDCKCRRSSSFSETRFFEGVQRASQEGLLATGARAAVLATDASIIAAGTLVTLFNPLSFLLNPIATAGRAITPKAWLSVATETETQLAAPIANIVANLLGAAVGIARATLRPDGRPVDGSLYENDDGYYGGQDKVATSSDDEGGYGGKDVALAETESEPVSEAEEESEGETGGWFKYSPARQRVIDADQTQGPVPARGVNQTQSPARARVADAVQGQQKAWAEPKQDRAAAAKETAYPAEAIESDDEYLYAVPAQMQIVEPAADQVQEKIADQGNF